MEVGDVSDGSLEDLLKTATGNVKLIEDNDERTSQKYKSLVIDTICVLDQISVLVASLHFFSNNETMDDVSTESLRFMLVNAYQGFVHQQHYDFANRKTYILAAKEYYQDFHHLCQLYGLAKVIEFSLNRLDNPVNQSNRVAKMQQYKNKKQLEEKIAELEKRENVEEEIQRDIYLSHIKLWIMKCEEELYNINSEIPMLEHMEKLRGGELKPAPVITPKVMKPFILVKSQLQKEVYGAGYPSLPTMTLNEYYETEVKRIVEEQERQKLEPKPVEPEDPDEETEETLAKARYWDDWKETHKRGWGNRHNRS